MTDETVYLMRLLEKSCVKPEQFCFSVMHRRAAECIRLARELGLHDVAERLKELPHLNHGSGHVVGASTANLAFEEARDLLFNAVLG